MFFFFKWKWKDRIWCLEWNCERFVSSNWHVIKSIMSSYWFHTKYFDCCWIKVIRSYCHKLKPSDLIIVGPKIGCPQIQLTNSMDRYTNFSFNYYLKKKAFLPKKIMIEVLTVSQKHQSRMNKQLEEKSDPTPYCEGSVRASISFFFFSDIADLFIISIWVA